MFKNTFELKHVNIKDLHFLRTSLKSFISRSVKGQNVDQKITYYVKMTL